MGPAVEELTNLSEVSLGKELHRSLENVCFLAQYRGQPVVVKKVIVRRSDSIAKFEEEVSVLCRNELKEAVVAPVAVVRAPPHYSIVLPFMANGSISTIMTQYVLPLEMILCFAVDTARALERVHASGFVHRDIKAANVLVGEDWRAWITDLGSAERLFDEEGNAVPRNDDDFSINPSGGFHKKTIDGTTLGYTAPEIFRNTPAVQASDIYALAMTFAEMLTGVPPFVGMEKEDADMHTVMDASYSAHSLMVAITNDHLRPGLVSVSERPGMPMELIELIRVMWHHDVSQRPSATQVVQTLEMIAAKVGVETNNLPTRAMYAQSIRTVGAEPTDTTMAEVNKADHTSNGPEEADSFDKSYQVHDVPTVPLDNEDAMEVEAGGDVSAGARVHRNSRLPVGAFATSGRRGADKMEDRHAVLHFSMGGSNGELTVCTVFDGHGGAACADFANKRLGERLGNGLLRAGSFPEEAQRAEVAKQAFVQTDLDFRNGKTADKSGCTAIATAMWNPNRVGAPDRFRLLIANAGDCRTVLCRTQNGVSKAVRLSRDHNAAVPEEQERIKAAGGSISMTRDGKYRVQGHIQVTRALGDAAWKPYGVTAEPEVLEYDLDVSQGDDFVIIATDGVWDTLSDQDAVNMVLSTAKECGLSAKRIGGEALARGSSDNISVVVCFLKHFDQHQDVAYVQ